MVTKTGLVIERRMSECIFVVRVTSQDSPVARVRVETSKGCTKQPPAMYVCRNLCLFLRYNGT